jgi:hypothetical protein
LPAFWPAVFLVSVGLTVVSVAASALFVAFLFLPWGNATFLLAIVTLFAWIASVAVRLAAHHP